VNALVFPCYALVQHPLLLGLISAIIFVCGPIYNVAQLSYRLALIPDELQGRVNSVYRLLAFGFLPLGWSLTGLLIQWFQVVPAILFLSACGLLLAVLASMNSHIINAGSKREEQVWHEHEGEN
jgi:hypothetical protein